MTERPSGLGRSPTAPPIMANGHFAAVGDQSDPAAYEHGVQVIDENKEFKYGHFPSPHLAPAGNTLRCRGSAADSLFPVRTCPSTCPSKMSRRLASTTTSSPCSVRSRRASPLCSTTSSAPSSRSCRSGKDGKPPRVFGCRRTRSKPKIARPTDRAWQIISWLWMWRVRTAASEARTRTLSAKAHSLLLRRARCSLLTSGSTKWDCTRERTWAC